MDKIALTHLIISNEGNSMVNSHSANEEIILQVTSVVIRQVDNQINMTLADQSMKKQTKKIIIKIQN